MPISKPLYISDQSLSNAGREEDFGEDDGADDDAGVDFIHILRASFFIRKCFAQLLWAYNLAL